VGQARGGEFDLIDTMARVLPLGGEGVVLGVGDDAAVLAPPRGEALADAQMPDKDVVRPRE
jgi:thiamine monophosphate kinase